MKRSLKKDSKYRKAVKYFEIDNLINKVISYETEAARPMQLANKFGVTSRVKVKTKCILTGRSKAVYNFFRLSRIAFKTEASFGRLEGVNKSSW